MKPNRAVSLAGAPLATLARAQDTTVVRACDRPSTRHIQAAFYGQLATIPNSDMASIGPTYLPRGRVVPSSVFFESGTHGEFAKSIRDWLPRARYTPARIGNCAVKALVREPFTYRIKD